MGRANLYWRVMLLVLGLLALFASVQAQPSEVPYIHFYDNLRGGLVIERADGTDSRLLTDLFGSAPDNMVMHGWSASGRWLATTSRRMVQLWDMTE